MKLHVTVMIVAVIMAASFVPATPHKTPADVWNCIDGTKSVCDNHCKDVITVPLAYCLMDCVGRSCPFLPPLAPPPPPDVYSCIEGTQSVCNDTCKGVTAVSMDYCLMDCVGRSCPFLPWLAPPPKVVPVTPKHENIWTCIDGSKSVCVKDCKDTKLTNAYCIMNCVGKCCPFLPPIDPPKPDDFKHHSK